MGSRATSRSTSSTARCPGGPTFGINLGPEEDLDPDECKNIWSPLGNEGGISARWTEIEGAIGFGHAIIDTMQNWMDNAQTRGPGYRDRIVVIKHTKAEGGMNLNMDPTLIDHFSERGRCAGEFLVNRFAHDPSINQGDGLSWGNHRWLRYRSMMPLVEQLLLGIIKGYEWPPEPSDQRSCATLVGGPIGDAPSYRWEKAEQRDRAVELTGGSRDCWPSNRRIRCPEARTCRAGDRCARLGAVETATQTLHRLTSYSWGRTSPPGEDDDLVWSAIGTVTPGVAGRAEPQPPNADPKADVR